MSSEGIPHQSKKPSNDDGNLSPTKRKKMEDLTVISRLQPRLYITDTLANVSIISSEKELGTDAYLQPAFSDIERGETWSLQLGMIMVTARRELPGSDQLAHNMSNSFARRVIVRVNPPDMTPTARRIVISQLAAYMNRTLRPNPLNAYIVPPDYDLTPTEMRSLSHYIKDSDVVSVVKQVMMNPVPPHDWSDWAANNPVEAPRFFARPYPVVAIRLLGYLNNDSNTQSAPGLNPHDSNSQYAPGFNLPVDDPINDSEENRAINYIVNEETADHERQEKAD